MPNVIKVHAVWDDEAKVWVATSDDVPGLVCESATAELLEEKLKNLIPELMVLNGMIQCTNHPKVPFHISAERDSIAIACA